MSKDGGKDRRGKIGEEGKGGAAGTGQQGRGRGANGTEVCCKELGGKGDWWIGEVQRDGDVHCGQDAGGWGRAGVGMRGYGMERGGGGEGPGEGVKGAERCMQRGCRGGLRGTQNATCTPEEGGPTM